MSKPNSNTDDKACFYSEEENGETGNEMFAADQLPRLSFFSRSSLAPFGLASHAGVFRGARFSSLPKNEKRAPLKMPAWEATFGLIVVKKARDFTIPTDPPISESGTGSLRESFSSFAVSLRFYLPLSPPPPPPASTSNA